MNPGKLGKNPLPRSEISLAPEVVEAGRAWRRAWSAVGAMALLQIVISLWISPAGAVSDEAIDFVDFVAGFFPTVFNYADGAWDRETAQVIAALAVCSALISTVLFTVLGLRLGQTRNLNPMQLALLICILWPVHVLLVLGIASGTFTPGASTGVSRGARLFDGLQQSQAGFSMVMAFIGAVFAYLCWISVFAPIKFVSNVIRHIKDRPRITD